MKRTNAGQIRIIEALLATLVIFSALATSGSITPPNNSNSQDNLSPIGMRSLMKLDEVGGLGDCIDQKDFASLREMLELVLPPEVCFNLTIYDENRQMINTETIANGVLSSKNTVFVEYFCASQGLNSKFYVLHLQLAVAA